MRLPNDQVGSGHLIVEVHTYPDICKTIMRKTELRTCISDLKCYRCILIKHTSIDNCTNLNA